MMNLNEMKSAELKQLAKEYGIKGWWNMKKTEMIAAITEAMEAAEIEEVEGDEEIVEDTDTTETVEDEEVEETEEDETEDEEIVEDEETEDKEPVEKKHSTNAKTLTYNGKTQTLREWADEVGITWHSLRDRVFKNGWSVEEALTTPKGGRKSK